MLPAIIFEGTTTLDVRRSWRNAGLIAIPTVVGLPLAVVVLGAIGTVALGSPLLVALLFASIIRPTGPAAVLSIFDELDVPERLAVTIEGESLLNDGVAVAIFSTLPGASDSDYCQSVPPWRFPSMGRAAEPPSFDTVDETIRSNHYDSPGRSHRWRRRTGASP